MSCTSLEQTSLALQEGTLLIGKVRSSALKMLLTNLDLFASANVTLFVCLLTSSFGAGRR
jgi:hypothetical protein